VEAFGFLAHVIEFRADATHPSELDGMLIDFPCGLRHSGHDTQKRPTPLSHIEHPSQERFMTITLIPATLTLLLACGLASQTTLAKDRKHDPQSPAHTAAVHQCRLMYDAAAAAAHAPNGPKGNARKRAMHAAAVAKKDCVAKAPR
jgi:hypothetical protein